MINAIMFAAGLFAGFANPPQESKPWCYWLWQNTTVDRQAITADLEDMRRLGFAGVLFSDTRGYGQSRVNTLAESMPVFSPEWYELFSFALREAARCGIKFTMNISSSGGTLKGPWPIGEDAPKHLVVGTGVSEPDPSFTNYHYIATFALKVPKGAEVKTGWANAGGILERFMADKGDVFRAALDWREIAAGDPLPAGDAAGEWVRLTYGYKTIPGHECDVDVIDAQAVERHFNRLAGPIFSRAGDLVGKTLTHFYSVSWEGAVPSWTADFERQFERRAGYSIRPYLPAISGWKRAKGPKGSEEVTVDYRTIRNDMFRDNFYGTFRDLCHKHGMGMYSESGGPWNRGPSVFKYADQLEFLAVNDIPQGESWTHVPPHHSETHHNRPAAACARLYGKRLASCESFTHMDFHWSVWPAFIKQRVDQEFADGINLVNWHTYTCSPASQGVPGLEYFAGTHINRNVTWNPEAHDIVTYISRCQHLLQWGTAVMDLAVYAGDNVYTHWDATVDRTVPFDGATFELPPGYTYDIVNRDVMTRLARREGAGMTVPCGTRYRFFLDCSSPDAVVIPKLPRRDCESPYRTLHRTDGRTDLYFLYGEGACEAVFDVRPDGRSVELWQPLDGTRQKAEWQATDDGRTRVKLCLPRDGSVFVVFLAEEPGASCPSAAPGTRTYRPLSGPWNVSFAYPRGIRAKPPKPAVWKDLHDWTKDADWNVKNFSGTATYRTTFRAEGPKGEGAALSAKILLNEVPNGCARVFVNGADCGLAWCAPWTLDVSKHVRDGENDLEIRVTNTWRNRLIADTRLPPDRRVTTSCLNYFTNSCMSVSWVRHCGGYCPDDPRVSSGLPGPVVLVTEWK